MKEDQLFCVVFCRKDWYKAYVPAKNASECKYKFVNGQYDMGTEDHEYDPSKKHVDTIHIESVDPVEEAELPKRYKDYMAAKAKKS